MLLNETRLSLFILFFAIFFAGCSWEFSSKQSDEALVAQFFENGNHTNNWAVLVGMMAYFHESSSDERVLSIYYLLKKLGLPDSRIILMTSNNVACNVLNREYGRIEAGIGSDVVNVYEDVEVDYRGEEVNVVNLFRVLTDRHPPATVRSKRMLSDGQSNVLLYLSSHGAETGYMSVRENEYLTTEQLGDAIADMRHQNRYNEILVVAISCNAGAMCRSLRSENVMCI